MNVQGIGLGLKICKQLAEMNHGEIDVFSRGRGMGTTFMFTMKMTIEEPDLSDNMD